ncbi:MAG TPA: DUF6157 family protein [Saprospiraceae bacterium]|nr:DUF6157 family protein [Saprospiraceae bacterium]HMQ83016.1 DUF6157 family protein [Saprospiraceae bacterium]
MHTTNYFNTFIEIAPDCPVTSAEVPPNQSENTSIATLQFEMIAHHPYGYTSDEVLFAIHCKRKGLNNDLESEQAAFFSKGQPCLRSSPLPKRYGWGLHYNDAGKVAIYPVESEAYKRFQNDDSLKQIKAMRSKRG